MKICFAPMEGITTRVYRSVFRQYYGGVDRFYTPFLAANHTHHFKKRERKEVEPYQTDLVPQILTASAEDFLWAADCMQDLGYHEVNLNLGCPYPTVFTKGKGAGMLEEPDRLHQFFEKVFSGSGLPDISVKTRIGVRSAEEAATLAEVFADYPFKEIIIHPRVREQYYDGTPYMDVYKQMASALSSQMSVIYNGDVRTSADVERIRCCSPETCGVMIGRGLLSDPALAMKLGGEKLPFDEMSVLSRFVNALWDAYGEELHGERDVLFKMKELWSYLGCSFKDRERALLDIKKSKSRKEYAAAVERIFE